MWGKRGYSQRYSSIAVPPLQRRVVHTCHELYHRPLIPCRRHRVSSPRFSPLHYFCFTFPYTSAPLLPFTTVYCRPIICIPSPAVSISPVSVSIPPVTVWALPALPRLRPPLRLLQAICRPPIAPPSLCHPPLSPASHIAHSPPLLPLPPTSPLVLAQSPHYAYHSYPPCCCYSPATALVTSETTRVCASCAPG